MASIDSIELTVVRDVTSVIGRCCYSLGVAWPQIIAVIVVTRDYWGVMTRGRGHLDNIYKIARELPQTISHSRPRLGGPT